MAQLHNDAKNLRFRLELVDRERTAGGQGRVLAKAAVELFDRRVKQELERLPPWAGRVR
ncbi:MAG: hypothetical protein HYZ28_06810 [Myxococcales bacterium]|nr:hypothetical protein [Myxococcales bacterium]